MLEIIINFSKFGIFPPKQISKIKLWNDGSGTPEKGNYKAKVYLTEDNDIMELALINLKGFERKRGHLELLKEILIKLSEKEEDKNAQMS